MAFHHSLSSPALSTASAVTCSSSKVSESSTRLATTATGAPAVWPTSTPNTIAGSTVDIVWLDHSYAKPWSSHPDASNARPVRMIFMNKYPRKSAVLDHKQSREQEGLIDVDSVSEPSPPPYDVSKANMLMNECERHINFARTEEIGDQWEERISNLRASWSPQQNRLFHKVVKALYADRLARLSFDGHQREPIQRRIHIDKAARRIRQALAGVMWDIRLTQWLHGVLIENLSQQLLGPYLDILQVLRSKTPSLVDKMMAVQNTKSPQPSVEALNLLLKRPWDPASSIVHHNKLKRLPSNPLLLVVTCGPAGLGTPTGQSRRTKFWHSQLSTLGRVVQVSVHAGGSTSIAQCLENMIGAARTKVIELRAQHSHRPIVLIGWNVGALVACHVSLIERVTAVVCLGFPLTSISGPRGDIDDPILESKTPTLFVIGQFSETCRLDDLEDLREKMRADNSLLVVGGADSQLRVTRAKKKQEGITQIMADRCVQEEIAEFLGGIITQSAATGLESEVDPEIRRKQQQRRKKPPPIPKTSSDTAIPVSPPKAGSRSRTASLSYFEQLMTSPGDTPTGHLPLSRSYDSRLLAMGVQAQRAQAKQSLPKRKKSPSATPSSTPAKRRAVRSVSSAEATVPTATVPGMANIMAIQPGMSGPIGSSHAELSNLLAGQLPQYLQTPATVAALQAAMGLRPPTGQGHEALLAQRLSQGDVLSGVTLSPVMQAQQASPVATTPSLAQRLALTVSNLQERLKTSYTPPSTPGVGTPQESPKASPLPTPPVKTQASMNVARPGSSCSLETEGNPTLSPIKSALAAGPMPIRSLPQSYGSASTQIQNIFSSIARQTAGQQSVSPLQGAYTPVTLAHGLSHAQLLGLEAHQQLQYAASLAAISPPAGSLQRVPTYVQQTMSPVKQRTTPELVQSQEPVAPAKILLPAPGTLMTTPQVVPSHPTAPATRASAEHTPTDQERVLAIQKLQFHDFPLTTATISKTTGTTEITQAKILNKPEISAKEPAIRISMAQIPSKPILSSTTPVASASSTVAHSSSSFSPMAVTKPTAVVSIPASSTVTAKPQPSRTASGAVLVNTEPLGQVPSVVEPSSKKTVILTRPSELATSSGPAPSVIAIPKATVVMTASSSNLTLSQATATELKKGVTISTKGPPGSSQGTTVINISTGPLTEHNKSRGADDTDSETLVTARTALPSVPATRSRRTRSNKSQDT